MAQTETLLRNLICGGFVPAGGVAPTSRFGQGFTVSAAVAGVSTITIAAPGVPTGELYAECTTTVGTGAINPTSATTFVVTTNTAPGVATNEPYFFCIWQITPAP